MPLLTDDAKVEIIKLGLKSGAVQDGMNLIEEYEKYSPPQREPRADDPVMFQFLKLDRANIAQYLAAPTLPDPFYHWLDKSHAAWNSGAFARWVVHEKGLIDPISGRVYGGYGGVIRVLVAIILIGKTTAWSRGYQRPNAHDLMEFGKHIEMQLKHMMGWVLKEVKRSIDDWIPKAPPAIPPGNRSTPWAAKQVHWINARSSGSDDPSSTRGQPPSMLHDFLHPTASQMNDAVIEIIDEDSQAVDKTIYSHKISPMIPPKELEVPPPSAPILERRDELSVVATAGPSSRLAHTVARVPVALPVDKPPSDTTRRSLSEPRSQADIPDNALLLDLNNPTSVLPSPNDPPEPLPGQDLEGEFPVGFDHSTPHPRGRTSDRPATAAEDAVSTPVPVTPSGNTPSIKRRVMESIQVPSRSSGRQAASRAASIAVRPGSGVVTASVQTPVRAQSEAANTSNFLTMAARQVVASRRQTSASSAIAASVIAPSASASTSRKKRTRSNDSTASNSKRGRSGDRA
ncbi:hypothetical protein FRC08_000984 [Ceratobasidium sp. 394]|nr:hypothetical protein FRC08_000984 [Ceratobasidium sp. 394]